MKNNNYWKRVILICLITPALIFLVSWMIGGVINNLILVEADKGKNIVELIETISWLIIIFIGLVALFHPLSTFLEGIGSRITKVSLFDISIEVAELSGYTPTWSKVMGDDVRRITPPEVLSSASGTLFQEMAEKKPADYAVIDLGDGQHWLTSRLYLFAIMLERVRGLKAFVFVASVNGNPKCYVGTATTEQIRWQLSYRYPLLEKSYAVAYSEILSQAHNLDAFLTQKRMTIQTAQNVAQRFLNDIQEKKEPVENKDQWVSMQNSQKIWEPAKWLEVSSLKEILGDTLYTATTAYSPLDTPQQQATKIAAQEEPLIALIKPNGKFHSLVDRRTLLETVGLRALSAEGGIADKD